MDLGKLYEDVVTAYFKGLPWHLLQGTVGKHKLPPLRTASPQMESEPSIFSIKVKVKLCPCALFLNQAPRHEGVLEEWRYSSMHSLTLALDGGEWSDSHASSFMPRESTPGTHWIGDWMGPRAVLVTVVNRKLPSPAGDQTLEP
jgi:hypothetical protein